MNRSEQDRRRRYRSWLQQFESDRAPATVDEAIANVLEAFPGAVVVVG